MPPALGFLPPPGRAGVLQPHADRVDQLRTASPPLLRRHAVDQPAHLEHRLLARLSRAHDLRLVLRPSLAFHPAQQGRHAGVHGPGLHVALQHTPLPALAADRLVELVPTPAEQDGVRQHAGVHQAEGHFEREGGVEVGCAVRVGERVGDVALAVVVLAGAVEGRAVVEGEEEADVESARGDGFGVHALFVGQV